MPQDNNYEETFLNIIIPFFNYFENKESIKKLDELPKYF